MKSPKIQHIALDLLEASPRGMLLLDQDWLFVYGNPMLRDYLGLSESPAAGDGLWDLAPELMSYFYKPFRTWSKGRGESDVTGFYPPTNRWLRCILTRYQDKILITMADVSADQARIRKLQEVEIFWNRIYDSVVDVVLVTDHLGFVQRVNPAVSRVFGYRPDELVGQNIAVLMGGGDRNHHERYMSRYLQTGRSAIMGISRVVKGMHKNGRMIDLELSVNSVQYNDEVHYVGVLRDVSERVAQEERISGLNRELEQRVEERTRQLQLLNEELERMAMYDTLTGLANRAQFTGILKSVYQNSETAGTAFSILMLDLNGFKQINDTLGHHVGDRLLRKVAERIRTSLRDGDVVARIGGDEFVILLDKTTQTGAERAAQKLCQRFDEPFDLDSRYVDCTCSIGIAVYPLHGRIGDLVQQHADLAMYYAKRQKLGYSVYSDKIMEDASEVVARISSGK